jgi:copper chaperone CopZ
MKKVFLLEDLDCAHCAEKIEREVAKLDGVSESKVTFLTQKLTVEVEESKAGSLLSDVKKIVKKVEPDVTVVEK